MGKINVIVILTCFIITMLYLQNIQNTPTIKIIEIPQNCSNIDSMVSDYKISSNNNDNDNNNNDDAYQTLPPQQPHKLALVGVLTTAAKFHRRSLIRMTYKKLQPSSIDFYFILGKPKNQYEERLIQFEVNQYNDILILDCEENMDSGKTFHYFQKVFQVGHEYSFVMKTDDDVWLDLSNLAVAFKGLPFDGGVYWGRHVQGTGFMAGMGYAVSWDLVEWIATDPYPALHKVGQEDGNLASWLLHGKKIKHYVSNDEEIYDEPESKMGWAHPYTKGTLLIHRLKNDEWFLKAADHFLLEQGK